MANYTSPIVPIHRLQPEGQFLLGVKMLQANFGHIFARHERIKNEKNFFVSKGKDFVEGFLFGVKPLRKFLHLFWEDEELAGARWAMEELNKLP